MKWLLWRGRWEVRRGRTKQTWRITATRSWIKRLIWRERVATPNLAGSASRKNIWIIVEKVIFEAEMFKAAAFLCRFFGF